MNLKDWIFNSTANCDTVVEFGAGFYGKLSLVSTDVKVKIGVEISQVYIDQSSDSDVVKIKGDMREFEKLFDVRLLMYPACAMFIDSLEHLSREDAFDLISKVQKHFNRIILMIPEGIHEQNGDVTGHGQHEFQKHRSTWYLRDVEDLGFQEIEIDAYFHQSKQDKADGAIFAIWRKNDQRN